MKGASACLRQPLNRTGWCRPPNPRSVQIHLLLAPGLVPSVLELDPSNLGVAEARVPLLTPRPRCLWPPQTQWV